MDNLIKFKAKSKAPKKAADPHLQTASDLSHDLAKVLNNYHGKLPELMLAGVVTSMLTQVIFKSSNYKKTFKVCASYLLDQLNKFEKNNSDDDSK